MSALTKYSLKFLELLEHGDELSRADLKPKTGCGNASLKMTIWKLLSDECVLIKKISHFSYYSITDTGLEALRQCREELAQKERIAERTVKAVKMKAKQAQVDTADTTSMRVPPRTLNLFAQPEYHTNKRVYYRNDGYVGIKSVGLKC